MTTLNELKIKMTGGIFEHARLGLIANYVQSENVTISSLSEKFKMSEHAASLFISFLLEARLAQFTCDKLYEHRNIAVRSQNITEKIESDTGIAVCIEETAMYMHPTHVLCVDDQWITTWNYSIIDDMLPEADRDNIDEDILDILVWNAVIDDVESMHADGFFYTLAVAIK